MMIRNLAKRITALFCLILMLVSSCGAGIIVQPAEVQAVAIVDDLGAAFFELLVMIASLSAGASKDDVVIPREKAGITDYKTAVDYAESCYGYNSGIKNVFDFSASNYFLKNYIPKFALIYLTSEYVVSKEWCQKLWSSRSLIDGSSALIDFEKASFYSKSGTILQFPNMGDDNDNDDEEEGKTHKYLPPSAIPSIYSTEAFTMIYMITQAINRQKFSMKLTPETAEIFDPTVCDYSRLFWLAHPDILTVTDSLFVNASIMVLELRPKWIPSSVNQIYPLVYYENNVPWFCLASNAVVDETGIDSRQALIFGYRHGSSSASTCFYEFSPWKKGARLLPRFVGSGILRIPPFDAEGTVNRLNSHIYNRKLLDPVRKLYT